MKPLFAVCSCLCVIFSTLAVCQSGQKVPEAADEKERVKREGVWSMISFEINGEKASGEEVKRWKLVIKGNEYTIFRDNKQVEQGTHRIDVTQKPYREDFTITEGDKPGKTCVGIYSIEGSRFTCCYAEKSKGRPAEFKATPGTGRSLVVWERSQK
jgi:uncharacterized protein (TIGR03067 family)